MKKILQTIVLLCLLGQMFAQSTDSTNLSIKQKVDSTIVLSQNESTQVIQNSDSIIFKAQFELVKNIIPNDSAQIALQALRFKIDSTDYKVQTSTRLELSGNYMSRIMYSGRDYGVKGYGLSSQLSYKHQSGLWLSAIAYHWQKFDVKLPKTDLVVGYAATLGKRVGASVSYSRWLYYGKSQSQLKWAFNHFMSTYIGINAHYFSIAPQIYYMISPAENVAQFALTISKNKEWRPFMGGKLIFEPNFTWMTSTKDRIDISDPTKKAGKILRVIDYELGLPLIFRKVGKYEITTKYVLSLPVNVGPYDGAKEGKLTSLISLDFKYILWQKKNKK